MNTGVKFFSSLFVAPIVVAGLLLLPQKSEATTWNEPFLETVAQEADALGIFKIEKNEGQKVSLSLVKHIAGKKTPQKFTLEGFFHLELGSVSAGHGPSYEHTLAEGMSYYLYIKQSGKKDVWQLATPTAGLDHFADKGRITATYRFSAHDTLVDTQTYEMTHACIFRHLHGKLCDTEEIKVFIDAALSQPVGILKDGLNSDTSNRFFQQHMAMETAYLLDLPLAEATLDKFLNSDFFHVQISAVRALSKSNIKTRVEKLLALIQSETTKPIVKVFAVLALEKINDRSVIPKLKELEQSVPEDEAWLGMNIMDPRVGTRFPGSTRNALTHLLKKWGK